MRRMVLAAAVAAVLLRSADAAAQQPEMPKWDAGASFGLMFGNGWYPTDTYDEPQAAYHFELGRFWTSHLKTDAAVILTHNQRGYEYGAYPVAGAPFAYSYTEHERRLTAFSGAITYQFFENAMMHPFVSAGLQVGASHDHAFRNPQVFTANRITYTVPALDTRSFDTIARPYVSVGAKSYFNERTFVKSEWSVAVGNRGVSHSILRLGFGFDF